MRYLEMLYRLSISLWAGGNAIFTLLLTPILFRTESRDTAGRIVGAMFPAYFRWGVACGIVALVVRLAARGGRLQIALLTAMLALTLFQSLYIEPKAAKLKQQIGSFETTPREHPLRREFSRLHGVSAVCNLLVLTGGVVLVILP